MIAAARNVTPKPTKATINPATLAPMMRMVFIEALLSATALVRCRPCTMLGMSDCRAGWSNALNAPLANAWT